MWKSIGGWFDQAAKDTSTWASQAWKDTTAWTEQAWKDTSTWTVQAWHDVTAWTTQAWDDSSKWVSQAWSDSSTWAATNWDSFIVWVNTITHGNPYSWINEVILEHGILAYEKYIDMRSFLAQSPSVEQLRQKYDDELSALSLLDEDKDTLWITLEQWVADKGISTQTAAELALPFLARLIVEGESAIGEEAVFTGAVVTQYILTTLEAIKIDSDDAAGMQRKILNTTLDSITRPVIIGDTDQNILITDDQYCIENYTYADGKYQIVMIASMIDESSQFPMMRGETIEQQTLKYFAGAEIGELAPLDSVSNNQAQALPFTFALSETTVTGKAVAIWTIKNNYLFFVVTDQEMQVEEFENWYHSIALKGDTGISFQVDMVSDGAFYGINQSAQKYTINRIFDEEKFTVPKTGHGWAAERGNNLIDNLMGFIKGRHSTIVGDNNVKNGADRLVTYADGSRLLIQTKYHSTASSSISSCFDNGLFRYMDADGKPMAIEVPADQYNAAIRYMKNRIANGEVSGVTDTYEAVNIVKKEASPIYRQSISQKQVP